MTDIQQPVKAPWRWLFCKLSVCIAVVLVFFGVVVVIVGFMPATWYRIVVDTGNERIERASIELCGREFPISIRPGQITAEYYDDCSSEVTILMRGTANQYDCSRAFDDFYPSTLKRYKIVDGKCRRVDDQWPDWMQNNRPYRPQFFARPGVGPS